MGRICAVALCSAIVAAACSGSGGDTTTTTAAPTTASPTTTSSPPTTSSLPTTTTEPAATVVQGGVVVIGSDQEPPTLNPFLPGGDVSIVHEIAAAVMARVWAIDAATRQPVAVVVNELPTLRNGGLRLTDDGGLIVRYDIRPEAVWADGTPISGEDFLFTYRTVMDPALPTDKTAFAAIDADAMVVNPKSFIFRLSAPVAGAATMFRYLIPRHAVEGTDFAADWNDTMWVAGGPFEFSDWSLGESLTLTRNDGYWMNDPESGLRLPHLDEVVFRFISETRELVDAIAAGTVDVARVPPAVELRDTLDGAPGVVTQRAPSNLYMYLMFHFGGLSSQERAQTPHPEVMSSWNFRRAIASAVDRRSLAGIWGDALPLGGLIELAAPAWDAPGWSGHPYDPETARELITAGCAFADRDCRRNPPPLELFTFSNNTAQVEVARAVAVMLDDVGFRVSLTEFSAATVFGYSFCDETYDVAVVGGIVEPAAGGIVDLAESWDPALPCPEGPNFAQWGTPDSFDTGRTAQRYFDLVAVMRQAADRDALQELALAAEALLGDHVVLVPLFALPSYAAVRPDALSGFVHNPFGVDLWNAAHWRRPSL